MLAVLLLAGSCLSADARKVDISLASLGVPQDVGAGPTEGFVFTSADGRLTLFQSLASNLVAGQIDLNDAYDVFLHDRVTDQTTLISHELGSDKQSMKGHSYPVGMNADGSVILFVSSAGNAAPGIIDGNNADDVFLLDRSTGVRTLVSHAFGNANTAGNAGTGYGVHLSADASRVAFASSATDLVNGVDDANGQPDVFVYERAGGQIVLASRAVGVVPSTPNSRSRPLAISADGKQVLFTSVASNVAPTVIDTNATYDLFLFDSTNATTALVSHAQGNSAATANAYSLGVSLSADGNTALYSSEATNLVEGVIDTNSEADVFTFDLASGANALISHAHGSMTTAANEYSQATAMSDDGRWVLFDSRATDVMAGISDSNSDYDVFLLDRDTGSRTLITRSHSSPTMTPNFGSTGVAMSADANRITFYSYANNLISGLVGSNGGSGHSYMFERSSGITTLVSRALNSAVAVPNSDSYPLATSSDGDHVFFSSSATNIVPGVVDVPYTYDVFRFDYASGATMLLSRARSPADSQPTSESTAVALSANERCVVFENDALDVAPGLIFNSRGVFLFDRETRETVLVSRRLGVPNATPNFQSYATAVNASCSQVLFRSYGTDVLPGVTDSNAASDVFLFDRASATTTLVSRAFDAAATANGESIPIAISADGNLVLFSSKATNLIAGLSDSNGGFDVFLFNRASETTTTLVSRAMNSATETANASSFPVALSANGGYVVFHGSASNVVPGVVDSNGTTDVFLFSVNAKTNALVSASASSATTASGEKSGAVGISADGNRVLYYTYSTDVVAGISDVNDVEDAYVFDRLSGTTTLASRALGVPTATADRGATPVAISANGNGVLLESRSADLVAGVEDHNADPDVFVFDRTNGETVLVSRSMFSPIQSGNIGSTAVAISGDGNQVLFDSYADNIVVQEDLGDGLDLDSFLFDRQRHQVTLISRSRDGDQKPASRDSSSVAMSSDGDTVLMQSRATDLVRGLFDSVNGSRDVFVAEIDLGAIFGDGLE